MVMGHDLHGFQAGFFNGRSREMRQLVSGLFFGVSIALCSSWTFANESNDVATEAEFVSCTAQKTEEGINIPCVNEILPDGTAKTFSIVMGNTGNGYSIIEKIPNFDENIDMGCLATFEEKRGVLDIPCLKNENDYNSFYTRLVKDDKVFTITSEELNSLNKGGVSIPDIQQRTTAARNKTLYFGQAEFSGGGVWSRTFRKDSAGKICVSLFFLKGNTYGRDGNLAVSFYKKSWYRDHQQHYKSTPVPESSKVVNYSFWAPSGKYQFRLYPVDKHFYVKMRINVTAC